MKHNRATHAYRDVDVYSAAAYADPHRLIGMLLDGALDRLARAKGAMQLNDTALKGELLGAVITIVDGLRGCLKMDQGDTLSNNLADLYDYVCRRLLQANAANEVRFVDEVVGLLKEIRMAWEAIPEAVRAGYAAGAAEAPQ